MSGQSKFSDAVATTEIGKVLSSPSPFVFSSDKVRMRVVGRNDNGVVTLEVSLFGVRLGQVQGKPGSTGYRFDEQKDS